MFYYSTVDEIVMTHGALETDEYSTPCVRVRFERPNQNNGFVHILNHILNLILMHMLMVILITILLIILHLNLILIIHHLHLHHHLEEIL